MKPSSYKILNTNNWQEAREFVIQPIVAEEFNGLIVIKNALTGKAYGARSSSYEMIRHEDAVEGLMKALVGQKAKLASVQLDNSGARMHLHVNLKAKNDYTPRIVLTNSYDGTLSFGIEAGLTHKKMTVVFETVQRWVHFGNKIDVTRLKEAIEKVPQLCVNFSEKIKTLAKIKLKNPRQSAEWFLAEKIVNKNVVEKALELDPITGSDLFYALNVAITEYEASPTRKRDMQRDIVKVIFEKKWVKGFDSRKLLVEN